MQTTRVDGMHGHCPGRGGGNINDIEVNRDKVRLSNDRTEF